MSSTTNRASRFARGEALFSKLLTLSGIFVIVLLSAIFITLIIASKESIAKFGMGFIISKEWDPVGEIYGALPFILGTFITSVLSIIISTPFSLAIAILLGEYETDGFLSNAIRSIIELMAGIPSVIFGFWGLFFLVPIVRNIEITAGIIPYGVGILTSSLILSVMIIPYSASVSREVIAMTPKTLKEAALSLGATRFEVITKLIIPNSFSGISAGILLAFGRAIGETMAVTMLIGNDNSMPTSIFNPANTMASIIANEFAEATTETYLSALFNIGLVLFVISIVVNLIGRIVIKKMSREVAV